MAENDRRIWTRRPSAGGRGGDVFAARRLPPEQAEAMRRDRRRVQEEMERELDARTAKDRKEAARLAREAKRKESGHGEGRCSAVQPELPLPAHGDVLLRHLLIITGMPVKFPTSSSRASSSTSGAASRTPPSPPDRGGDAHLLHGHHFSTRS